MNNSHNNNNDLPAIHISGLKKIYKNGLVALKGVDIDVARGDFFALLGPNGAGKSTLINILISLVNKSEGKVAIFGNDIDKDFIAAKSFLGVVPQEFNFSIFEKTEDIIMTQAGYYGIDSKTSKLRCEYLLKKLDLWSKRNQPARFLSGGMKRRLMIARALMHSPKILILDEPTAGVDLHIRHSIWKFLTELNQQGTTIVLTTHYLEEAEHLCQKVAIINHGEILVNTSMSELLNTLQRESFILILRQAYQTLPVIAGYGIKPIDEMTLEVEVPRDKGLGLLISSLQQLNYEVVTMKNKSNQLEQLFLNLTGKHGS